MAQDLQDKMFNAWLQVTGTRYQSPEADQYDMPGYFKDVALKGEDQSGISAVDNQIHFPDTYKLPGHPTFSAESKNFDPKLHDRKQWLGDMLINLGGGQNSSPENIVEETRPSRLAIQKIMRSF